jgi:glycosyltransferase involved in cell wall biosynthesis
VITTHIITRPTTPSTERTLPFISVVVPTFNRAAVLPYLLGALARQTYPSDRMEVIVVDNSSTDDTEEVIKRWQAVVPFELSFFRKENRGPAASRNYGAARAKGDFIAFTDSDCLPSSNWLARAADALVGGAGIVCGPIVPRRRHGAPGLMAAQLEGIGADRGTYPTANLFVRAAAFKVVGGFDETFGLYPWGELMAGEDADLAWRLKRKGESAVFMQDVVVDHLSTRITAAQLLLRPVRVRIFPRLLRTIPELRQTYLWGRVFLARPRVYFHLAWIGVVAALLIPSWLPLLAVVPWVVSHSRGSVMSMVRRGQVAKGITWLLAIAWFETLTTLALLAGSVRYRRLVL